MTFIPGAVCDGTNFSTPANLLLQGKHLSINSYVLPHVFEPSRLRPGQYTGYDVDLMAMLSQELGFTFSFNAFPKRNGSQTWTGILHEQSQLSDLVGTYWCVLLQVFGCAQ